MVSTEGLVQIAGYRHYKGDPARSLRLAAMAAIH